MAMGQLGSFALGGPIGWGMQQGNLPNDQRSGLFKFLAGTPERQGIQSRYSPQIQGQLDQYLSQILGQLGGGQFDFAPIEQQARSGFAQKTVPSIAERFTSMGAGGGRSSAFGQQLGQAGAGLDESLAAMRQNYGLQQQQLGQGFLGLGQQEPFREASQPGFLQQALLALLQGAGGAARGIATGGF